MPQRTTTDVINLGQYLEPDFDPTSLTIPLLFGILSYHNVKYPTSCSKRELVKLFNDKIKSRSTELRTERNQNTHELDSEGITDGLTGASLPLQPSIVRTSQLHLISNKKPNHQNITPNTEAQVSTSEIMESEMDVDMEIDDY